MDHGHIAANGRSRLRHRGIRAISVALTLLLIGVASGVARSLTVESPSPAHGYAQVIAQGVGVMPAETIAWRVVREEVAPPGDAKTKKRRLGFVLADGGALAVEDSRTGSFVRLAAGEAAFVAGDARQIEAGLAADAIAAYQLELLPAADAKAGGATSFVSDPFAAPGEGVGVDLDLVRSVLAPGQKTDLSDTGLPTLILATTGRVEVVAGGQTVSLAAGEAVALTGDLTVTGKEQAAFVAAVIGPAVPRLLQADSGAPIEQATATGGDTVAPVDSDGDGLSDEEEATIGTSPDHADSDGDGATDGQEVNVDGTDPLNASDGPSAETDTDGDGLSDYAETTFDGSDPNNPDTDGDGLNDHDEVFNGTSPNNPDSDGDGVSDGDEVAAGTDPRPPCVSCLASDEDEDGDGVTNGDEIDAGTDPFDPSDF